MRRMVSSLKPGGADSVSMSVTNPYLYSVDTRSSIVSVAVLMKLFLPFARALRADAVNGDVVMVNLETLRSRQTRSIRWQRHIKHFAAGVAVIVAMLLHVR